MGSHTELAFEGPRWGETFEEYFEEISLKNAVLTYISFLILTLLGRLQDRLREFGIMKNPAAKDREEMKDFVPLYSNFEAFFTRKLYRRARDCWNRPICSAPGSEMVLVDRV